MNMTQKTIGQYTVQIEEILDSEGEIVHYKVNSDIFNGRTFRVLSEDEVTEERIGQHLEIVQNFQ